MRIDKFLKVSRLIKRRTVANEACDAGRVLVNGKAVKASYEVKKGDVLELLFGQRTVKAEVLDLAETTKKEEANAFEDEYNTFIIPLQKASGDDIASSSPDEFNANKVITSFNI